MTSSCIFCKLVDGELPAQLLYEDEFFLSFLDINPVVKGHTLVIPKSHYKSISETPDDVLSKGICLVKHIAQAQYTGLGAEGVNVIQNNGAVSGQAVPHLHFHVIPRFSTDGHDWNWAAKSYTNKEEQAGYLEQIKNAL